MAHPIAQPRGLRASRKPGDGGKRLDSASALRLRMPAPLPPALHGSTHYSPPLALRASTPSDRATNLRLRSSADRPAAAPKPPSGRTAGVVGLEEHPQGASTTGCTLARNRLLPALACLEMTWQCDRSDIEENEMTGQF
ncbi:uncharacterized protein [Miscanthus floridulus]|uniref:uncharacterized protein n=1 Tax=Miscanthus floridulus TaxID=154761 RepID=UPI003457A0E8